MDELVGGRRNDRTGLDSASLRIRPTVPGADEGKRWKSSTRGTRNTRAAAATPNRRGHPSECFTCDPRMHGDERVGNILLLTQRPLRQVSRSKTARHPVVQGLILWRWHAHRFGRLGWIRKAPRAGILGAREQVGSEATVNMSVERDPAGAGGVRPHSEMSGTDRELSAPCSMVSSVTCF
jgi:hypothetical protein